ncbi:unnamed protein product, partial [Rotaria sp. Silwood2]
MIYLVIYVASFSRTIHGGSTPLIELIKNIDLYRQASICVSSSSFSTKGREYVSRMCSLQRQITFNYRDDVANMKLYQRIPSPSPDFFIQWPSLSQTNTFFYKTLFIDNVRFSGDDFTIQRRSNDTCILYKSKINSYSIGFILSVVHAIDKNQAYILLNK